MASIGLVLAGIFGAIVMIGRDRWRLQPFLPLDLFRDRTFRRSVLFSICCFTGLSLALLMLPFALHARLAVSALGVAMLMMPWSIAVLVMTPATTRLLHRNHAASLCAAGGVCLSVGLGALAIGSRGTGALYHLVAIALCGAGFGLFQTPNNRTMFLAAAPERAASAGGVQGTARLTGQMVGSLFASLLFSALDSLAASWAAFALAGSATFAAAMIALTRRQTSGGF